VKRPAARGPVAPAACGPVTAKLAAEWLRMRALPSVLALAALTEVGLRTVPLDVLCRRYGIRIGRERGHTPLPVSAAALTPSEVAALRTVERVYRFGARAERGTCLRRALVGGALLRKRAPVLRLGCTRIGSDVRAHAWLELAAPGRPADRPTAVPAAGPRFTSLGAASSAGAAAAHAAHAGGGRWC